MMRMLRREFNEMLRKRLSEHHRRQVQKVFTLPPIQCGIHGAPQTKEEFEQKGYFLEWVAGIGLQRTKT